MQTHKKKAPVPRKLIEAAKLLSKAKRLIYLYQKEHECDAEIIFPCIFEIEYSLNMASRNIANIVSTEFEDKFYYNS
jgi:hypothetical protein